MIDVVDFNGNDLGTYGEIGEFSMGGPYLEGKESAVEYPQRAFLGIRYTEPTINGKQYNNTTIVGFSATAAFDQIMFEFGFVSYSPSSDIFNKFVYRYKHQAGNYSTDPEKFNTNWTLLNVSKA